jgi:hypothetical protein
VADRSVGRRRATRERRAGEAAGHRGARRDEHPLLALQRLAGNAAVALLVQRQDAPPAEAPLGAAQVAHALSFYRRQPALYTAEVIGGLRTRLGLDPAGGIDADLAQAVARFQRDEGANDPALRVDGMAGPRSTPRLFPTGLAAPGEGSRFGGDAQSTVFDHWEDLGSAQARADALVAAVNQRLAAAGVPELATRVYDGDSPREQGSFDFPTWTMQLNRLLLEQGGLGRDDAADLANTVYHEARHSEQWFAMARLRAGQGRSAAAIATELGIPARIATAAHAVPIRPGSMEAVSASGWYESVYGSQSAHREAVLSRLDAADWAVTTERCRCQQTPSPANDARLARAQERFDRVHDEYRELPEENDAWATGPMAEAGVTHGTAHPAAVPDVDPCERLRRAGRPVPAAAVTP